MDSITSLLVSSLLLLPPLLLLLRHLSFPRRLSLPPSPPSLPLIGHLHLLTSMPHHSLTRLASDLATPILHLRLGRVPTVVVSTPRLAREVLKIHDPSLCSRPQLLSAQYLSFGCSDVTFSPHGPYWRQARRICVTELLSPRRVAGFRRVRHEEVTHMLRSFKKSTSPVDVSSKFLQLANDVLCRVAFGRRFDEVGKGSKKGLAEVLEETQALFAGFDVGEFFPGMGWVNGLTGLTRRLERNLADLRAVCDLTIDDHLKKRKEGGEGGGGGEKEDFVDVLLRVQKSRDLEVPITDDNLKALVLDMFVAGTDTTSATLEWVMTDLVLHPTVLSKAQCEIRTLIGPNSAVTEDHLPNLHYTKAVVKETLRLHPPVPLLVPRESIRDCVIDGYDIPAKTRVLVNTYAIGRDVGTWGKDALEYRPERFENDEVHDMKGVGDFELLPFGGGRRGCPGYSFALPTVELALGRMLYHFDWRLPAGVGKKDVDVREVFGLATRKKEPLVLVATEAHGYELQEDVY